MAAENRYTRPSFSENGEMRILAGRHPVIERLAAEDAGRFIPNDLYLNDSTDLIAIITGPNMGGKSTYLRQAALISILAQMGSFMPADSASLPIVDRIFTRIGASDNLARGRSTFMVEMTETAVILNTATPRSLIVLDEIGRGTATFDGLALAWAVVEHIHARTQAKTLVRHALSRADRAGRLTRRRAQLAGFGEGSRRPHHLPAQSGAGQGRPQLRHRSGAPGRAAAGVIERAREVLKLHERTEHVVTESWPMPKTTRPCRSSFSSPWAMASPSAYAASIWTSCGPSRRCNCWPICRRS